MIEIDNPNPNLDPEASQDDRERQRLTACMCKLIELREYAESSISAPGALEAEIVLVENIPVLETISGGNLRNSGNVKSRVELLSVDAVRQTQEQIDLLVNTFLVVGGFATARRLEPYLPVSVPKTRAGHNTLKFIAEQFSESYPVTVAVGLENTTQLVKILSMLDKRVEAEGLDKEELMDNLNVQARERAQIRIERLKQDGSDQLAQMKTILAHEKIASMKREPVELPGTRAYSRFEVLANQIIQEENLTVQVDVAKEKARKAVDSAKETTLNVLAKKRAIRAVMMLIGQDPLLSQEMARRQRVSLDELLAADESTQKQAANNILSGKRVILSVEERRVFNGETVIAQEKEKVVQALQDPFPFIANLLDEELTVIRTGIPKISDDKSVFDLAGERLRQRLEAEVTDEELVEYLTKVIVGEILSTQIGTAVDNAIVKLGINRDIVLDNPNTLLHLADAIAANAIEFLISGSRLPNEQSVFKIGSWESHNLAREIVLPEQIQDQALECIKKWGEVFPKEQSWVQDNFGIPSLIVRIDGIDSDGKLVIYEVEDRPAGIGHTVLVNEQFRAKLVDVKNTWPDFDIVVSPLRDTADDELWGSVAHLDLVKESGKLVFVRAEPWELQFRVLQGRSLSTISTEGDKSYGVPLGLWTFVNSSEQLPQNRSFVLKPLQSSKGKNMAFYDVRNRPGNNGMKSAIELLENQIKEKGGMYMQDLFPPMESGIITHPFMIYRFFFGFDISANRWIPLGGTWFARNNLKIHGASDSISGPLVIK